MSAQWIIRHTTVIACAMASPFLAGTLEAGESIPLYSSKSPVSVGKRSVAGGLDIDPNPRRSGWRLAAGPFARKVGNVDFQTGDRSWKTPIPSFLGSSSKHLSDSAGSAGTIGDRTYDDGYVNKDAATGVADKLTWFWGFNNPSQVVGGQLVFHQANAGTERASSRSSTRRASQWSEDPGTELGSYLELNYDLPLSADTSVGPQLGYSFVAMDAARTSSTFLERQDQRRFQSGLTDNYDLNGVIPPLAPFAGGFSGPGPLINNLPTARSVSRFETGSDLVRLSNRIEESLSLDLHTFSLGGQFRYDLEGIFVQAAAGFTLNVADWTAAQNETLYLSRNGAKEQKYREWRSSEDHTDALIGGYLQLQIGADITERIYVAGFGRYDWSESLRGEVGPSQFKMDLNGFSGGLLVGIRF